MAVSTGTYVLTHTEAFQDEGYRLMRVVSFCLNALYGQRFFSWGVWCMFVGVPHSGAGLHGLGVWCVCTAAPLLIYEIWKRMSALSPDLSAAPASASVWDVILNPSALNEPTIQVSPPSPTPLS